MSGWQERGVDARSLEYVEQINTRTWTARMVTSCIRYAHILPALMDAKMAFDEEEAHWGRIPRKIEER